MRSVHPNDIQLVRIKRELLELFKDGFVKTEYMGMEYKTSFSKFAKEVLEQIKKNKEV